MFSSPTNTTHKLQGTYEIDEDGLIIYFFSASSTDEENQRMIGQSFYDYLEILPVSDELERRIKIFIAGSASTDSFDFDCVFQGVRQKVLVLLARIRKKVHNGKQDLIVIDIKPEPKTTDFS